MDAKIFVNLGRKAATWRSWKLKKKLALCYSCTYTYCTNCTAVENRRIITRAGDHGNICDSMRLICDSMKSPKLFCDQVTSWWGEKQCDWMGLSYTVTKQKRPNYLWPNVTTLNYMWPNAITKALYDWTGLLCRGSAQQVGRIFYKLQIFLYTNFAVA